MPTTERATTRTESFYDRRRLTPLTLMSGRNGTFVLVLSTAGLAVDPRGTDQVAGPVTGQNLRSTVMERHFGSDRPTDPTRPIVTTVHLHDDAMSPARGLTLSAGMSVLSTGSGHDPAGADFCDRLRIAVHLGRTPIFQGSADGFGHSGRISLGESAVGPGQSMPLTFSVSLDASAGHPYASCTAAQRLTLTVES